MSDFRAESETIFQQGGGGANMTRFNKFIEGPGAMIAFDQQISIIADEIVPNAECAGLPMVLDRTDFSTTKLV